MLLADLFLPFFQLFLEVFPPLHCFVVLLPEMRAKSPAKKNTQISERFLSECYC